MCAARGRVRATNEVLVTAESGASLADKVEFLTNQAWSDAPPETIETHMSWVFLTGDRAYKLKKLVRLRFVDHRSLEARRIDCDAEVDLNQPLAPGVYLNTIALR